MKIVGLATVTLALGVMVHITAVNANLLDTTCDAVVIPTIVTLENDHGIASNGLLARAGADEIVKERTKFGKIEVGDVRASQGFDSNASVLLHAMTPDWKDGAKLEEHELALVYYNALGLADKCGVESIAFPLLGQGQKFPDPVAIRTAIRSINGVREFDKLKVAVFAIVNSKLYETFCEILSEEIEQVAKANPENQMPNIGKFGFDHKESEVEMAVN